MEQKPFSMDFVLNITKRHMRKAVDISIRKTFERLPEFVNDEVQSKEVFKTLGSLHTLRKSLR